MVIRSIGPLTIIVDGQAHAELSAVTNNSLTFTDDAEQNTTEEDNCTFWKMLLIIVNSVAFCQACYICVLQKQVAAMKKSVADRRRETDSRRREGENMPNNSRRGHSFLSAMSRPHPPAPPSERETVMLAGGDGSLPKEMSDHVSYSVVGTPTRYGSGGVGTPTHPLAVEGGSSGASTLGVPARGQDESPALLPKPKEQEIRPTDGPPEDLDIFAPE